MQSVSADALSDEVRVAIAPAATYEWLLAQPPAARWRLLARPAMVLLIVGTIVPIMAVERVTVRLVAMSALSWSFVLAAQAMAAVAVIVSAPARRASLPRALDLWFASHLPYSLWMLFVAAWVWATEGAPLDLFLLAALVPALWTIRILFAYCRAVLGTTEVGARWRIALHQCAIWSMVLVYVVWAAGGATAVTSFIARRLSAQ